MTAGIDREATGRPGAAQIDSPGGPAEARTEGRWLGPSGRPLMGWLTTPAAGPSGSGVLVLPDVGAQYASAYRTLRVTAERLAAQGHTVLRLDYDGTGDSAGAPADADRVAAWRASAAAGARELRELGCVHLTIFGVRLGAILALLDGAALGADEVIAWAPARSGGRYVRGLRLLGEPMPGEAGVTSGGAVFSTQTIAEIGALELTDTVAAPAPRTLLLGDLPGDVVGHLEGLGGYVERQDPEGAELALDRPTEYAEVPEAVVEVVAKWVTPARSVVGGPPEGRPSAQVVWERAALTEAVVELGGLVGVLTEPDHTRPDAATVVFLNSGSDSHVGPGRAWVEYARSLGAAGHRALRVDWRGWGESPDAGLAPGRPYAAHTQAETVAVVEALQARGYDRIVLMGLCASAWLAMQVALDTRVAGVIALNPQLYWQPGDPVLSQTDTHVWRTAARARDAKWGRWGFWTGLDFLGHRDAPARWLDRLAAGSVPVLVLYAEGDDGLVHLRHRLARRVRRAERSGMVRVGELAGIDHGMMRTWLRPVVLRSLLNELDRPAP